MKIKKVKYEVHINIKHPQISLELILDRKKIDEKKWNDENNLSRKLLFEINELLKKNKIDKKDLGEITVNSSQESFNSTRIAKAIALAGNFCIREN